MPKTHTINRQDKKTGGDLNFRQGFKDGMAVGFGYLAVGIAFGALAVAYGLSPKWAFLISFTNLTSAGQFVGIGLIKAKESLVVIGMAVFIINIRYFLMSLSLSQKTDKDISTAKRCIIAHGITDENFVIASLKQGKLSFPYMVGLMSLPIAGWSLGAYAGAISTGLLPKVVQDALGIALYGMFIALIVPAVRKSVEVLFVVALAVGISCLFFYTSFLHNISSGVVVIICTILSAAIGACFFPKKDL